MRSVKEALQHGQTTTKGPQVPDGILTIHNTQGNEQAVRPAEAGEGSTFLDDGPTQDVGSLYARLTWSVPNYSSALTKRELRSEVFEIGNCRWYILVYPQGCDICNHLSLFLCVADYDELLPGWNHFAQFTIAVINKDPKKNKYSDTLHRFCKKEHDWGWKKFMELSKVLDGFTHQDTLVIKAQVQVIIDKPGRPFRCLHPGYKRELVRVYLTNVETALKRFCDERRARLSWLQTEGDKVREFWQGLSPEQQQQLTTERAEVIMKGVVKQFLNEKEVTSTLIMDALYSGYKQLDITTRSWLQGGNQGAAPQVLMRADTGVCEVPGDISHLITYAAQEVVLTRSDAAKTSDAGTGNESVRSGGGGGSAPEDVDARRECGEGDELHLADLGSRTAIMYIISHVCTEKLEVAYREAEALARQDQLIAEELLEQSSDQRRREQAERDKERRAKKKERLKARKEEERARKARDESEAKQCNDLGQQEDTSRPRGTTQPHALPHLLPPPPALSAQQSRYAVLELQEGLGLGSQGENAHHGGGGLQGDGSQEAGGPLSGSTGSSAQGVECQQVAGGAGNGYHPSGLLGLKQQAHEVSGGGGSGGGTPELLITAGSKYQGRLEQSLASFGSDCSSLTADNSSGCVEELQAQLQCMRALVDSLQAELLEKDRHLDAFKIQVAHLQAQLHTHATWTTPLPSYHPPGLSSHRDNSVSLSKGLPSSSSLQLDAPTNGTPNTTHNTVRAWAQPALAPTLTGNAALAKALAAGATQTTAVSTAAAGGGGAAQAAAGAAMGTSPSESVAGVLSGRRVGQEGVGSKSGQGSNHSSTAAASDVPATAQPSAGVTPSYRNAAAGVLQGSRLQPPPPPPPPPPPTAATTSSLSSSGKAAAGTGPGVGVGLLTTAAAGNRAGTAAGGGGSRGVGGDAVGGAVATTSPSAHDELLASRTSSCSNSTTTSCATTPSTFPAALDIALQPPQATRHASLTHVLPGFTTTSSLGEGGLGKPRQGLSGLSSVRSCGALGAVAGQECDDLSAGREVQTAVHVPVQVDSPGLDDFAHMGIINDLLGPDE